MKCNIIYLKGFEGRFYYVWIISGPIKARGLVADKSSLKYGRVELEKNMKNISAGLIETSQGLG